MTPDNNHELDPTVTQQPVPHTGQIKNPDLAERPVEEFPGTSLQEAVDKGFVDPENPPHTVEDLPEAKALMPPAAQPDTEKKHFPRWAKIAAPIVAAAALAGGIIAATSGGDSDSSNRVTLGAAGPSTQDSGQGTSVTTAPETTPTTEVQTPVKPSPTLITKDPTAWMDATFAKISQAYQDDNPDELNGIWQKGSSDETTNKAEAVKPGGLRYAIQSVQVTFSTPDEVDLAVHAVINGNQPFDRSIHWVIEDGEWVMEST